MALLASLSRPAVPYTGLRFAPSTHFWPAYVGQPLRERHAPRPVHEDPFRSADGMSIEFRDDDEIVDPTVSCQSCDAVCCRLTVVVMPEDDVPRHLVERNSRGLDVMARGEDGWCIAVDHAHMRCGIYSQRPEICRKFAMGSAFCREERETYREQTLKGIPLVLR